MTVKTKKSASSKPLPNQQNTTIIAIIVAVAVLGAAIFIYLSSADTPSGSNINYAAIPQERMPDGGFVLGNPDAPVTIIEFADFLCPHCASFTENVLPQLKREFGDSGQASFHHVDFLVMDGSDAPAVAAECVYRQDNDAFWEVHPAMMRSQAITRDPVRAFEIARDYAPGIDVTALEECIADTQVVTAVRAEREMAIGAGATGTPSIFVNGRSVQPSYAAIANAISAELD